MLSFDISSVFIQGDSAILGRGERSRNKGISRRLLLISVLLLFSYPVKLLPEERLLGELAEALGVFERVRLAA